MPWRERPEELAAARAEHPLVIPAPRGQLFGVFTPPAAGEPARHACAVLFTRPRSHRNRMWVEGARRLAGLGFAAFRFDYHGTGDSGGEPARLDPNAPYRDDAVAVLRHLRGRLGQERFVLVGSCFDGRTALSAFADEASRIEGLAFLAAPVVDLTTLVKADADRKDWRHLARALRNPENWRALGRLERWKYMATVTGRIARRSAANGSAGTLPLAASFRRDFDALARSRAKALFLYGAEDAEYQSFRIAETGLFPRLPADTRARFEVTVWPGELHGFLRLDRQREALEAVLGWIDATVPAREPAREAS